MALLYISNCPSKKAGSRCWVLTSLNFQEIPAHDISKLCFYYLFHQLEWASCVVIGLLQQPIYFLAPAYSLHSIPHSTARVISLTCKPNYITPCFKIHEHIFIAFRLDLPIYISSLLRSLEQHSFMTTNKYFESNGLSTTNPMIVVKLVNLSRFFIHEMWIIWPNPQHC